MQIAQPDSRLSAHVLSRRGLLYSGGALPAVDRPAHVRAASGVAWLGRRLAIIQDDAQFIALVDPESGAVDAVPLPADAAGKRLFDDTRGTKRLKADSEACFTVRDGDRARFFVLGSGSKALRERIVVLDYDGARDEVTSQRTVSASSLYASLRAFTEFSGSRLNIEGALVKGSALLLFQRGNGARRAERLPVNAVATLPFATFSAYVESGGLAPAPAIEGTTQYDLGSSEGVAYTFTDATLTRSGQIVFLASAEDSSSAITDGTVHGTIVGELADDGAVRTGPLLDAAGAPLREKAEGIVFDPSDASLAWIVVDPDDPARPAELLQVRFTTPF